MTRSAASPFLLQPEWAPNLVDARQFWSLRPIARPPLPPIDNMSWPIGDLDHFVLAKLEEQRMSPTADADRTALLRRLSFDLIGLPPTPEAIADFVADGSSGALKAVVDRLLASPRFGERWGRHWLDVA